MDLNAIFRGKSEAKLIVRGNCNVRGINGGPVYREGKRFMIMAQDTSVLTFIADDISIKPLFQVIADGDFDSHIFGKIVAPLIPEQDQGVVNPSDECTVISFSKDSYKTPSIEAYFDMTH